MSAGLISLEGFAPPNDWEREQEEAFTTEQKQESIIATEGIPLGQSLYNKWIDQTGNIIYDEEQARAAMFIGLVGRFAVLLSGPPGTGKTLLTSNIPRLVYGADETRTAMIPADSGLQARELTGFDVVSKKTRGGVAEEEFTTIDALVAPDHWFIDTDELSRIAPYALNALLGAPEERRVRSPGKVTELPDFQLMMSTMNPSEAREPTYQISLALASRHAVGEVMGYATSQASNEKLLDDVLPDVSKVQPVVSLRQLAILREVVATQIKIAPNDKGRYVAKVEMAEALITKHLRATERGRMVRQVGRMAKINAMIDGTDTVTDKHMNAAIYFAMASRVGAKWPRIEEAPRLLEHMNTAVREGHEPRDAAVEELPPVNEPKSVGKRFIGWKKH